MNPVLIFAAALTLALPAQAAEAGDAAARLSQAQEYAALGDWTAARATLDQLRADDSAPTTLRAQAWNILATLDAHQGQLNKAYLELMRAVELDPNLDIAWENLGDVNTRLALQAYAQAARTRKTPRLERAQTQLRGILNAEAGAASSNSETTVRAALAQWQDAWQRRDAEAYLTAYAPDFRPSPGISGEAWRAQRRTRLAAARSVSVRLQDVRLIQTPGSIMTTFTEHLQADDFQRSRKKTLEWRRAGDAWRIVSETSP